ncbi:MAG: hypothetical protein AAF384_20040 [Pseudomonadota bacterium]
MSELSSAEIGAGALYFPEEGRFCDTRLVNGEGPHAEMVLNGLAVMELATATAMVYPGHILSLNALGDL